MSAARPKYSVTISDNSSIVVRDVSKNAEPQVSMFTGESLAWYQDVPTEYYLALPTTWSQFRDQVPHTEAAKLFSAAVQQKETAEAFWWNMDAEYRTDPMNINMNDVLDNGLPSVFLETKKEVLAWNNIYSYIRDINLGSDDGYLYNGMTKTVAYDQVYKPGWRTNIHSLQLPERDPALHPGVTSFPHTVGEHNATHLVFCGPRQPIINEFIKNLYNVNRLYILGDATPAHGGSFFDYLDKYQKEAGITVEAIEEKAADKQLKALRITIPAQNDKEEHVIIAKQATNFPDHGVMDFTAETVKDFLNTHIEAASKGMVMGIHCVGGVGRSGTLEVAYNLFDNYADFFPNEKVNLGEVIKKIEKLRELRPKFIQSPHQLQRTILLAQQLKFVANNKDKAEYKDPQEFTKAFQEFTVSCKNKLNEAAAKFTVKPVTKDLFVEVLTERLKFNREKPASSAKTEYKSTTQKSNLSGADKFLLPVDNLLGQIQAQLSAMKIDYSQQGFLHKIKPNKVSKLIKGLFSHDDQAMPNLEDHDHSTAAPKFSEKGRQLLWLVNHLIDEVKGSIPKDKEAWARDWKNHHSARMTIRLLQAIQDYHPSQNAEVFFVINHKIDVLFKRLAFEGFVIPDKKDERYASQYPNFSKSLESMTAKAEEPHLHK